MAHFSAQQMPNDDLIADNKWDINKIKGKKENVAERSAVSPISLSLSLSPSLSPPPSPLSPAFRPLVRLAAVVQTKQGTGYLAPTFKRGQFFINHGKTNKCPDRSIQIDKSKIFIHWYKFSWKKDRIKS